MLRARTMDNNADVPADAVADFSLKISFYWIMLAIARRQTVPFLGVDPLATQTVGLLTDCFEMDHAFFSNCPRSQLPSL